MGNNVRLIRKDIPNLIPGKTMLILMDDYTPKFRKGDICRYNSVESELLSVSPIKNLNYYARIFYFSFSKYDIDLHKLKIL